jgi:hypothetical protein
MQQEAVVPLENRAADSYILHFDNTGGSSTGAALANTSTEAVTIDVKIHDEKGSVVSSDEITLPALGHTSFSLSDRYPLTQQNRGSAEFHATNGRISVLGLNFNPTGAFSSIPLLAK